MAEGQDQEKTEAPTGKRRDDFRKKGQVAQSKEINTAALFTFMLMLWYFYVPIFWRELSAFVAGFWRTCGEFEVTPLAVVDLALLVGGKIGLLLAPVFLLVLVVGFFSTFLQIGWLFTGKPLTPDLSKLNPIPGLAKMISVKSLVEVVKSIAKILVVGAVAYKTVYGEFDQSLLLVDMAPVETIRFLGRVATLVLMKSCGILILLGFFDFIYQRWELEQKMKMTKQEQKEEHKESDGDPYQKARIRSMQHEMARKRMMADVPKADVVITNPTHLSVAISYDRDQMDAPRIVAKGADNLAMRIREIARESKVPLVENKPVARALYRLEVGAPVPEDMFKAVAEILAFVYSLKGRKPGSR